MFLYSLPFVWDSPVAPFLSFFALIPVFALTARTHPALATLDGMVAGAASFVFICPWLGTYHIGALLFVLGLEAFWFSIAFGVMSLIQRTKSRFALPAAVCVWVIIEIARSLGFLGFPYGTLAYSWYESAAMLAIASAGGVPLVGILIASVNASFLTAYRRARKGGKIRLAVAAAAPGIVFALAVLTAGRAGGPIAGVEALTVSATPTQARPEGMYRVALVQAAVHKQDSVAMYQNGFRHLSALSDEALEYSPDLVAWHETAIVPPIDWHLRHRPERDVYNFVKDVDAYLRAYPVPILIGNGYAYPEDKKREVEHNSAILYASGDVADRYDKVMLVPFTEYFPYGDLMPGIDRWLIKTFGYYWTPGPGPTIMRSGSARFATPVCFEDSFARYFASFDAPDFYIIQTNDSWAESAMMQEQHLSMSVFRAAETASIVLRSADTGYTAAVRPDGSIAGMLPEFDRGVLYVDVPLGYAKTTVYEAGGKNIDIALALAGLALALASVLTRRRSLSH